MLPLVVAVFSSTWLAAGFVGWYFVWGRWLDGWKGGVAFGALVGSVAEVCGFSFLARLDS